jgi:23S rRNA (uracil1939-C5)-methyltransferase
MASSMPVTLGPGSLVELVAERPVAGGRMLARHEGQVVLVSGTLPGERVHARITRASRHVVFAETIDVLEAARDRREPRCNSACGGLTYAHIAPAAQRRLKADVIVDALRRLGRITLDEPPDVEASPETGYRLRARLHVRGGRAGFFEEGTHTLCDAVQTGQLLPESHAAVDSILRALGEHVSMCDRVILAENAAATERVAHLEPRGDERLDRVSLDPARLESLTGVTTAAATRMAVLAGQAVVTDTAVDLFTRAGAAVPAWAAGVQWGRHAASFFQGNRFVTPALLVHVVELAAADRIVDLYAGVGLYSVALASRGATVTAVEGDRSSGADLETNAQPWGDRLRVVRAAVEDVVRRTPDRPPEVVVVNPPRSGISATAVTHLINWRAPRVVYVSCDPPTLARDAARLVSSGYALRSIRAFDLFPNTPHVETVVEFRR